MTYIVYLRDVVLFTTLQIQGEQAMGLQTQNYKPVFEREREGGVKR